ncbi:serine/threonine protein kinase, partial [Massospora cicadina]
MAQVQSLLSRREWMPAAQTNSNSNQLSPRVNLSSSCILLKDHAPSAAEPCLDTAIGQLDCHPRPLVLLSIVGSSHENVSVLSPPLKGMHGSESRVSSFKPPSLDEIKLPPSALPANQDRRHSILHDIFVPIRRIFHDQARPVGKQPIKSFLELPESESPNLSRASSIKEKYGCTRQVIGRGSGGTVRLVQKPQGKLFAVKEFRLKRDTETRREYLKRLTSEFCISSSLHHDNVIQTLDLVFEDDRVYEIMEYCPHQLYRIAERGVMSAEEVDCCFAQMVQAISYLQSMGIAHRDLKPENFVLDDHGILKLIDFGCSVVYRTAFEPKDKFLAISGLAGSEPYMPPEVFSEEAYDPRAVDLWSLGIVYFAIATQQLPWRIALVRDQHYRRFIECPAYPEKMMACLLTASLRPIILGLLTPDPSRRLTVAQVVAHPALQAISRCTPDHASPTHYHHLTY